MKYVLTLLLLSLAFWSLNAVGSDESETLTFSLIPPKQPIVIFGDAWEIYAEGFIDAQAANRLESLIEKHNISPYSVLYLNSLGGSLGGGIELGRIIRKHGLSTSVGRYGNGKEQPNESAQCFSACALAYLGGRFRYFNDRNAFGVHRFYSVRRLENEEDRAQILSAFIVSYLQEVGIPGRFFIEMTRAGPKDIILLSKAELETLGVVNNGFEPTRWSIEALPGADSALYLKGERDTQYGINKFIILCEPEERELVLLIIFDPQGRQDEVLAMRAISLIINSKSYPVNSLLNDKQKIINDWVNAEFSLSAPFVDLIMGADTVGMAFQLGHDAPTFLGFQGMKFADGRPLLRGLRAACGG